MKFGIGRLFPVALAAASTTLPCVGAKQLLRRAQSDTKCRILRTYAQFDGADDEALWRAMPLNGKYEDQSFVISLKDNFLEDVDNSMDDLRNGNICVNLNSADFDLNDKGEAVATYDAIERVDCGVDRPSTNPTGTSKEVLVIRSFFNDTYDSLDDSPSTGDMRDAIFKEGSNSLSSRLHQCSDNGLLDIDPPSENVGNIERGILDVPLEIDDARIDDDKYLGRTALENVVVAAAKDLMEGKSLSDFGLVIVCLPQGEGDWQSEGYFNWPRSVYNGYICTDINHLMHEVGLNFGLHRALDQIGMMGPSTQDRPKRCFDPVNSWKLGWYDHNKTIIDVEEKSWAGRITSIEDYVEVFDHITSFDRKVSKEDDFFVNVLAKIEFNEKYDLYVGLNSGRAFNRDTPSESRNSLIVSRILKADDDEVDGGIVETLASLKGLDGDDIFTAPDYKGDSDKTLFIQVCDFVDEEKGLTYARIVVNIQDKENAREYLTCEEAVEQLSSKGGDSLTNFNGGNSEGSGGVPPSFFQLGVDYIDYEFQFAGEWYNCESLRIHTSLSSTRRAEICENSAGKFVCLDTCIDQAEEIEQSLGTFSGIDDMTEIPFRLRGQATSSTTITPTTTSANTLAEDLCEDKPGTIPGRGMTCNDINEKSYKRKEKLCKKDEIGGHCAETCRLWMNVGCR
uniref:Peptidase M11 gametolysin domain-containing protein n=1 Tax=Odontella aurita TaxID=265563 RepID=A0A7S4HZW7_9STRA|mmetsp:Transcript_17760/g.51679  ORF Transcript_17760/g.51679 Transcript_17760/m.51679 type:complete len:679 (+) Transcript_17760:83-2119(+)